MRKFQVSVNGNIYEVEVAEVSTGEIFTLSENPSVTAVRAAAPVAAAPVAAPVAATSVATAPVASAVGSTLLEAPMQGKIVGIKVTAGQSVKAGDVIAILEAMKMENELLAPKAGTVVSVDVAVGKTVEAGDLIASLN